MRKIINGNNMIDKQDSISGITNRNFISKAKRYLDQKAVVFLEDIEWYFNQDAQQSRKQIKKYKNIHRGDSCVVIGNGPSLKTMDLSWLRDKYTFGLNRIYLMFPELGFSTSYYVSVNRLVIEQCADEIAGLTMPKFIGWYWREFLKQSPDITYVRYKKDDTLDFSTDPGHRIWEGATVTYVALQLAYYMGFQKVYLIGVDHHFNTKGEPNTIVVTEDSDQDHFDPNYFGKGFRWHLPNLDRSEEAYRIAKDYYKADGREILDATVNGKLDIFPKVDYRSIE